VHVVVVACRGRWLRCGGLGARLCEAAAASGVFDNVVGVVCKKLGWRPVSSRRWRESPLGSRRSPMPTCATFMFRLDVSNLLQIEAQATFTYYLPCSLDGWMVGLVHSTCSRGVAQNFGVPFVPPPTRIWTLQSYHCSNRKLQYRPREPVPWMDQWLAGMHPISRGLAAHQRTHQMMQASHDDS
jgi:hypothetical protein